MIKESFILKAEKPNKPFEKPKEKIQLFNSPMRVKTS